MYIAQKNYVQTNFSKSKAQLKPKLFINLYIIYANKLFCIIFFNFAFNKEVENKFLNVYLLSYIIKYFVFCIKSDPMFL